MADHREPSGEVIRYTTPPECQEDPRCTYCARPLVPVHRYDALNESHSIALDDAQAPAAPASPDLWIAALLWRMWCTLSVLPGLGRKQRRLRRLAKQHPGSLICPHCGRIVKQQRP